MICALYFFWCIVQRLTFEQLTTRHYKLWYFFGPWKYQSSTFFVWKKNSLGILQNFSFWVPRKKEIHICLFLGGFLTIPLRKWVNCTYSNTWWGVSSIVLLFCSIFTLTCSVFICIPAAFRLSLIALACIVSTAHAIAFSSRGSWVA